MAETALRPLNQLTRGAKARVAALDGSKAFRVRVTSLGLNVGAEIEVLSGGNGNRGSVLIARSDTRLAVGHGMAEKILVEVISEGKGAATRTLFDLVTGDRARIVRIRGRGGWGIRRRLLDMGVTKGAEITVERHAPLGDPVHIKVKGYDLALRMSEAREIEVEALEP